MAILSVSWIKTRLAFLDLQAKVVYSDGDATAIPAHFSFCYHQQRRLNDLMKFYVRRLAFSLNDQTAMTEALCCTRRKAFSEAMANSRPTNGYNYFFNLHLISRLRRTASQVTTTYTITTATFSNNFR